MLSCQLLVISLNGTSLGLINRLIKQGHMPAVEKLIDGGSCGLLKSVLPALDYPTGASFHTGLDPGEHKVFGFSEIADNGLPTGRLVSWKSLRPKTLLEILSDNGKKIVSLYMPLTHPPKPLNGYIVSETLSQNVATYPSKLIHELRSQFGDLMTPKPRQFFPAEGFKDLADIQNFLNKQIQSINKTKELTLYLIRKRLPDVAFVQFYATDTVQHALWHYLDSRHPYFISDPNIEQLIYNFFFALDSSIEELIQGIKPLAVLVFSDHGFRPCVKILNLKRFLNKAKGVFVDFKTLYINTRITGQIYAGELIKRLEALVDNKTGKKIINHIWRAQDLYRNYQPPKNVSMLILEPAEGYTTRPGSAQEVLLMPCVSNKDYLSGTHTQEGFWAFFGHGVNQQKNRSAEILDLPPTILAYLGINKPGWMKGNTLFTSP